MAFHLIARNVCNMLRINCKPSMVITRHNVMPNAINIIPEKPPSGPDSLMLRNLRMAVAPNYGYGSEIYESTKTRTGSSSLAGDPKRLRSCQDIRAEILVKWNESPKPDIQKEWINKNMIYNALVL